MKANSVAMGIFFSAIMTIMADEPSIGNIKITMSVNMMENGDAKGHMTLDFHPKNYNSIKARNPNPYDFLRSFRSNRADYEIALERCTASYDDAHSAVMLGMYQLGAIHNRGNDIWEFEMEAQPDFINKVERPGSRTTLFFYESGKLNDNLPYNGQLRYMLPRGATDAKWDDNKNIIRYKLPFKGGFGKPDFSYKFMAKMRLMTAIYKIYGLGSDFSAQWVAKMVIQNKGAQVMRNLKVRYKLSNYSDWSLWDKFPEVVPNQTIVSLYYPVLDRDIAKLRSNTPANLLVEWRYEDEDGAVYEDSDGKRITLLGVNEFVFCNLVRGESFGTWHEEHNNASLIAAWASRNDPVIKQFASMANKNAAGVGGSSNDKNALMVLKACYELMQINDFTYQHPPSLVDKSVSFDSKFVQNIKFPRDVIRDKSGTCIDLAILYASMVNAVGLKPLLALIPGHCFPVVMLPSGQPVGVEVTGVGGGLRFGTAPFDKALEFGTKELEDVLKDGRYYLIDVQNLWTRGVANPELETLPADILTRWGIRQLLPQQQQQQHTAQQQQPQPRQPVHPAHPAQPPVGDIYSGTWGGMVTETLDSGQTITYPSRLTIQQLNNGGYTGYGIAEANVPTEMGPVHVRVEESYAGQIRSDVLVLQGREKIMTLTATGQREGMTVGNCVCRRQGQNLVGRIGNDEDGYMDFSFGPIQQQ